MTLQEKLSRLVDAQADKANELHSITEKLENKKQDLSSNDSAHYPSVPAVKAALSGKVDKVSGKVLSDENYTSEEKQKLAGLESSKFRGFFTTETSLPTTGNGEGSYADVDGGTGETTVRFIWDVNDSEWVEQVGESTQMTASQIKSLYESNADTNAFSDAEQDNLAENTTHRGRTDNPHNVTKSQVGLSNVTNTSDANKPVSTAQRTAIDAVQSNLDTHTTNKQNPHGVTKTQVGLSNVDNTSDINKPVSTAQGTAIGAVQSEVDNIEDELTTYYKAIGTEFPDYDVQYNDAINF